MKAVVLHEYGPPSNLKYEDFADPTPGEGEVLISVAAVSLNPVDWKMRSGAAKERFPVDFPAALGRDLAGVIHQCGPGVSASQPSAFQPGDRVMALAWQTYAQLCVVKATDLSPIPEGLEMSTAAAIPLVALTGDQLIRRACNVQPGETVLITGALGSVGRCAVFAAKELGAKVIAGVRSKQLAQAARLPGVLQAIAIDDDASLATLGLIDAVADTVGGDLAPKLLAKVKQGGVYGSVLGPPQGADLHPTVRIAAMMAVPDAATVTHYAQAVRDGKLDLPIDRILALADAAEAHAVAEDHVPGKIVLAVQ